MRMQMILQLFDHGNPSQSIMPKQASIQIQQCIEKYQQILLALKRNK